MQGKLEQKLRRTPQVYEIASELSIKESEVQESVRIGRSHLSLDAPVQEGDESRLMDLLQADAATQPDSDTIEISLREEVNKMLDTLTDRESEVVRLYFGIGEENTHTLEEIGRRFNLTRERARQIKQKALKRLKHSKRYNERLMVFSI
jgi:RNA polymerase primary sigma factor